MDVRSCRLGEGKRRASVLSSPAEAVVTRHSPFVIELSPEDRAVLEQRGRTYTAPHHVVIRAKIVLLAAAGWENTVIADRLDVPVQLVSKWRKRFFEEGLDGLKDRPRSGRPRVFSPCGRGAGQGVGL
jgi:Winged helix-turn helix